MDTSKPKNSTQRARAFIASLFQKWRDYWENERRLRDAEIHYDSGAGPALFLFVLIWIIALHLGK